MIDPAAFQAALLDWYDRNRRRLPWRAEPGRIADPYAVWLSEIMLQQTTVQAVQPYYRQFLTRWPTVEALADAPLDDVLHCWAGLGYYARARNLHKAAKAVVARHNGRFPATEAELRALPGIGAYTAAAVAAIAFDRRAAVMDGNVERVLARIFAVETPLPQAKPELRDLADRLTPSQRPGDYAQAMMDLGATLCSPKKPACGLCPVRPLCAASARGVSDRFPVKAAKPEKPTRLGVVYWAMRADGCVLLRRRPEKGLLGGMIEVPTGAWVEVLADADRDPDLAKARAEAPLPAPWKVLDGRVTHTFTHFHLELTVLAAKIRLGDPRLGIWAPLDTLGDYALPTLFRKVVRHALKHA